MFHSNMVFLSSSSSAAAAADAAAADVAAVAAAADAAAAAAAAAADAEEKKQFEILVRSKMDFFADFEFFLHPHSKNLVARQFHSAKISFLVRALKKLSFM